MSVGRKGGDETRMMLGMRMSIDVGVVSVSVAVAVIVSADRRVDLVHFRPSPSAQR